MRHHRLVQAGAIPAIRAVQLGGGVRVAQLLQAALGAEHEFNRSFGEFGAVPRRTYTREILRAQIEDRGKLGASGHTALCHFPIQWIGLQRNTMAKAPNSAPMTKHE